MNPNPRPDSSGVFDFKKVLSHSGGANLWILKGVDFSLPRKPAI